MPPFSYKVLVYKSHGGYSSIRFFHACMHTLSLFPLSNLTVSIFFLLWFLVMSICECPLALVTTLFHWFALCVLLTPRFTQFFLALLVVCKGGSGIMISPLLSHTGFLWLVGDTLSLESFLAPFSITVLSRHSLGSTSILSTGCVGELFFLSHCLG